jgi:hypothetical protein
VPKSSEDEGAETQNAPVRRPRHSVPEGNAENGGFEPPRALTQHAFQACAIGR